MANRRYRPYRQELDEPYIPNITTGNMDLEMRIRQNQPSVGGFNYPKLEEDYPVTTIAEDFMIKERKRQEQIGLQEEINYRRSLIEDRASQLELKKAARELDMYEANLAREDAMLEQVPLARQALGSLDPRSQDYLQKRMEVYNQFPIAFEYAPFVKTVDEPLIQRHKSLTTRIEKPEKAIPLEEYEVASGILQDEETNNAAKGGDRVARAKILSAQRTAKMFEQQEGLSFDDDQMEQPEPSTTEPSSPQFKEGKIYNQGGIRYRYTNGQFVPLS
jgi:hypothetical protein